MSISLMKLFGKVHGTPDTAAAEIAEDGYTKDKFTAIINKYQQTPTPSLRVEKFISKKRFASKT